MGDLINTFLLPLWCKCRQIFDMEVAGQSECFLSKLLKEIIDFTEKCILFVYSDRESFVAYFHKKRKAISDFLGKDKKYTILEE